MKYCSKCDTIKPLSEFNPRADGPWNLQILEHKANISKNNKLVF